MAHAATINSLVSGLVGSITGLDKNTKEFNSARDSVIKSIRGQSHARVNQFLVKERLDGLVEKFAVFNRDDLSDALKSRLDEINSLERWTPDILSLFLELSDQPTQFSRVEDLTDLSKETVPEPELTWEEIVTADPLDEAGIWDDVERGYHSSVNGDYDEEDSEPTISTQASSLAEDDMVATARSLLVKPDEELLQPLRQNTQLWRSPKRRNEPTMLPELVVIQEVIAMLQGLPTNLFSMDDRTNEISLDRRVTVKGTSTGALSSLLSECTTIGSSLNLLRYSMSVPQRVAFLQSIQSSVRGLLTEASSRLGQLEQAFITPGLHTAVSSIEVIDRIKHLTRPLERISKLFQQCSSDQFAVLDVLYEECCVTQITGDRVVHTAVRKVFLAGLETYLRSIAVWIDTGLISLRDKEVSLVNDAEPNCEPGKLWHNRFIIRTQDNGHPFAPKCLQSLAGKLFALGKSRAFLRRLNRSAEDFDTTTISITPSVTLQTVFRSDELANVTTFEQLLSDALLQWIALTSTDCTPTLCSTLQIGHGLIETLKAIPYVFFSKDSSLFLAFGEPLFARLRSRSDNVTLGDRFILTELAGTTLGQASVVDAVNLYITVTNPSSDSRSSPSLRILSSLQLEYRFSWPIQNITRAPYSTIHSGILTLLLQISYTMQTLNSPFFSLRDPVSLGHTSGLKLRHRLRTYLNLLSSHLTSSTSALHSRMEKSMRTAPDVDAMVATWQTYDADLQISTFLSPKLAPLHDTIVTTLELCERLVPSIEGKALHDLETQFDEALHFLVPGIRGVSRGGGGLGLETLAERLEGDLRM